jgi:uncharacterized membrane protein
MTSGNPQGSSDAAVFDAVITPHRSLGRRGFHTLLVVLAGLSSLMSIPFYLLGAWPVMGFFGLDIALFYVMFQLNYRAARLEERVTLTRVSLHVSRMERRGRREWSFNPRWVRVARHEHAEFGLMRLALVQRDDEVEIARCLGASEKADFAAAFSRALASVRAGAARPS